MTFNEIKKDKTIKKYERTNDCYEIFYLDGTSFKYYSDNEKEEKKIKNKMIIQAIERQEQFYNLYKVEKNTALAQLLITQLPVVLCIGADITKMYLLCILLEIYTIINYKIKEKKFLELEKYKNYLENKEEFDKEKNKDICKVIEPDPLYRMQIDINTIDEFSKKEIDYMIKVLKNNN